MTENRPAVRPATAGDDSSSTLRLLGGRAHQMCATTRAADHFNSLDTRDDRNTGSWLMSSSVSMGQELAADIDSLARSLREQSAPAALQQMVARLRVRAHQLHAAAKAADHFLDRDSHEDRDTGSWLIATASGLAQKLATELDDSLAPRRPPIDKAKIEPHDAGLARRLAEATTPQRGAA